METYRLQEYNKRASYENKVSGDFHLTDMYDTEDSTIYDFFDQIGSLNVLMETYELLLDFDKYYEIAGESINRTILYVAEIFIIFSFLFL